MRAGVAESRPAHVPVRRPGDVVEDLQTSQGLPSCDLRSGQFDGTSESVELRAQGTKSAAVG